MTEEEYGDQVHDFMNRDEEIRKEKVAMIHLFDGDKEEWNDKSRQYEMEIFQALKPIVDKAKAEGVSLRDLTYAINMTANELVLAKLMGWG